MLVICEPVPVLCWSFARVDTGLLVFLWVLADRLFMTAELHELIFIDFP